MVCQLQQNSFCCLFAYTQLLCVEPGTNAEAVQLSRAHPNKVELLKQLSSNLLGCALDG